MSCAPQPGEASIVLPAPYTYHHDHESDCNTVIPANRTNVKRRLQLRVAAKLMLYLGFAGVLYIFVSAIRTGDGEIPTVPSMRVDISQIEPGNVEFFKWENRPVLVYRRTDADIVSLRTRNNLLQDASSFDSQQPDKFVNNFRSESPDWFVAIALGTGQGCTVELIVADDNLFQERAWPGGFMDSCGQDRYDFSGRVYKDQYASRNLVVPPYSIDGETLVLGQ